VSRPGRRGVRIPGRRLLVVVAAVTLSSGCGGHVEDLDSARSGTTASSSARTLPAHPTTTPTTSLATTAPNAVAPGKPGQPRGAQPGPVDVTSPDAVAAAVATAAWTWDTRIDTTPQDGARRAAVWMTPAEAPRGQAALTSGGGNYWTQLAQQDGWTSVTVTPDTEPPPAATGAETARRVFVTVAAHTTTGSPPSDQHWTVVVALSRGEAGRWLVSQVLMRPTKDGS